MQSVWLLSLFHASSISLVLTALCCPQQTSPLLDRAFLTGGGNAGGAFVRDYVFEGIQSDELLKQRSILERLLHDRARVACMK